MNDDERRALSNLTFNLVPVPDDVWRESEHHVPELHKAVVDSIFDGVRMARYESGKPQGVVVQGPAGSGKTHMLGMVRHHTQKEEGGYFFLVSLYSGSEFWQTVALAMTHGLTRPSVGWSSQLITFLRRITSEIGLEAEDRDVICGQGTLTPEKLDRFIQALWQYDNHLGRETQYTAKALVLLASRNFAAQDVADGYFSSLDGADWPEWTAWSMPRQARSARHIVEDISRLLGVTGPTVIAFDQLDMLFAHATGRISSDGTSAPLDDHMMISQIAEGLVGLRETAHRTLVIVACIPATWTVLRGGAASPFIDRFRDSAPLGRTPSAGVSRAIVTKHLAAHWSKINFDTPYDIWPLSKSIELGQYMPRALLRLVCKQINWCLAHDVVPGDAALKEMEGWPEAPGASEQRDDPALDVLFDRLVAEADISAALDERTENECLPPLLNAAFNAWVIEQSQTSYKVDPPQGDSPPIHSRLRHVLNEQIEDERHWAVRGISARHHAAVRSRVQKACLAAGLAAGMEKRRLILLRNSTWNLGAKTYGLVEQARSAGALTLTVDEQDLKVLDALRQVLEDKPAGLSEWLRASKPASSTRLLREIFAGSGEDSAPAATLSADKSAAPPATRKSPPPPTTRQTPQPEASRNSFPNSIKLGTREGDATSFEVSLGSLRRHIAIFAGSGSGKTVLIRRLLEESAMAGVSSIVLDPNNDLARLGDEWPYQPDGWLLGDDERSREYLKATEVIVWTPMMSRGNPLTFQPLPAFADVRHDGDELRAAVDIAVAALAPRARMDAATVKSVRGQAVLRSALYHFAMQNGSDDLPAFLRLLGDLPEDATDLLSGRKLATEMAETLSAVRINDPLFGGDGSPVDPGMLLTPSPGKRARISVISFVGLHSNEQRQAFVNQLEMALFAWIKRNPAGDQPLGGLFVMDEAQNFVPSSGNTPSTETTLQLASQARKYGLGLVFATQAPKGLHNRIPGNAATQFYGLLTAQVQINAAREAAQNRGSAMPNVGMLSRGEFYAASEDGGFEKLQVPMCLSHHPSSPLSPEEVLERAARSRQLIDPQ